MAINPVAVLKVVGNEAVYYLEGRKESEEISVVFVCRHDFVKVAVLAWLAVAIVGLPRVLGGGGLGGEREKGKASTRVRWVTAEVAPV